MADLTIIQENCLTDHQQFKKVKTSRYDGTFNPSTLGDRSRQVFVEFKTNLFYKVNSRTSRATQRNGGDGE